MTKQVYVIDGVEYEIECQEEATETEQNKRLTQYAILMLREKTGMDRKEFCHWLGIPYRTMQEWELGRRGMPEYVLNLISYKVRKEQEEGNI